MKTKILPLPILLFVLPTLVFAQDLTYYGTVTDISNDDVGITQCTGELIRVPFKSNQAVWVSTFNRLAETGDIISVRVDDEEYANAAANIAGGTCENLPDVLEALDRSSHSESDDEDFEIDDEEEDEHDDTFEDMSTHEYGEDGIDDNSDVSDSESSDEVSDDRPVPTLYEDDSDYKEIFRERMKERRTMMRGMHEDMRTMMRNEKDTLRQIKNDNEPQLFFENSIPDYDQIMKMRRHKMMKDLKRETLRMILDEKDQKQTFEKLKEQLKNEALLKNTDENLSEFEDEVDLEFVNPIKLNTQSADVFAELRGLCLETDAGGYVLTDMHSRIIARLQFSNQNSVDTAARGSACVGGPIIVKGMINRGTREMMVQKMKALDYNDELNMKPEILWEAGASLYKDVNTSDDSVWYTKFLPLLYDRGVFTGYSDGSFGPANPVTIAEISKIVEEASGRDVEKSTNIEISYDHWADKYLRHAKQWKLLDKMDNFDRPATRGEVIRAILRAYQVNESDLSQVDGRFTDTDDKYVLLAKKLGIVTGYADGTFKPDANINRAEVAKMITNAIEAFEDTSAVDEELETMLNEVENMDEAEMVKWSQSSEEEITDN